MQGDEIEPNEIGKIVEEFYGIPVECAEEILRIRMGCKDEVRENSFGRHCRDKTVLGRKPGRVSSPDR